jgi:WD40 repeat protein/serine/threonine protein kinase
MNELDPRHPSADQLQAFSLGRVGDDDLARIAAHLDDCPTCRQRVDGLCAQDPLLWRLQAAERPGGRIQEDADQRRQAARAFQQERRRPPSSASRLAREPAAGPDKTALLQPPAAVAPSSGPAGGLVTENVGPPGPSLDDVAAPGCPRQIGEYHILGEVGRGGMGVVYKARHRSLHRLAAVKMVLQGTFASAQQLHRFQLEAELAARVQHANIVQVYEIGSHDGQPFLAMEWVEGGSLAKQVDGRPWPAAEAARLIESLAHAIHAAHSQGVIHRDLKPANVLLQALATDEHRSTQMKNEAKAISGPAIGVHPCSSVAHCLAKITDFGLARPLQGDAGLTKTGVIVGTPGYMAPEQASGTNALVGPAADVFALGVMLYELLTGQRPFQGDSALEVLRAVTSAEPTRPRRLQPSMPRDLEAVVLKCLEKEPGRRYPLALELAEDLRRFLDHKPVQARGASVVGRLGRWARRNRGVAAALCVIALLLISVAIASSIAALRFERLADEREVARTEAVSAATKAVAEKNRADREADAAWRNQYIAHMNRVESDWEHGNIFRILDTLAFYREPPPDRPDVRGWEWYYQDRLCHQEVRTLRGHAALAFSPDGKRLASASGDGRTVKVWDASTGQEILSLKGVTNVAFSPDGKRLASASYDSTVRLWDAASGQELRALKGHTGVVSSVAFSPDGTRLASCGADQTVRLWDAASGQELRTLKGHTGAQGVAFSPDGILLASAANGEPVKVWDAVRGQELRALKGHNDGANGVAFSPDGTLLASANWDGTVSVWDTVRGQELRTLKGHTGQIWSVAFSPDGTLLASAGIDKTVRLWDAASGQELRTLKGHTLAATSVVFCPDGAHLASASDDGTVKVWAAASSQECRTLKGHTSPVLVVAFSPDGTLLASAGIDMTVRLWDAASGQELRALKGHTGLVNGVAFSPDGTRLASCSFDQTVKVWDAASGRELRTLKGHTGLVNGVAFSPDGTRLASCGADQTVRLWDAASGQELRTLKGHTGAQGVAFSPNGTRLASCDGDIVKVWDAASGQELRTLKGHTSPVLGVAFSPDGKRLVSGSWDQTVKVWDAASGQELRTLKGHTGLVNGVAFSPDGTRLASCSFDQTVKVWDGRPLTPAVQAEVEAVALLELLFSRPLSRADVCAAIKKQELLSEAARQQALEVADRFYEETDPRKYLEAAWPVVRQPHANVFLCELAVAQLKAACRLAPGSPTFRRALGVAQYRLGKFHREEHASALATLLESDQNHPTTLAFLAMSQFQEGRKEQARGTLVRLRELTSKPPWSTDAEAASFLREAATLIEDKPAKPSP